MKILITLSYYSPYVSGLTLAAKNLAELLASDDYEITILTTQHEKKLPLKEVIGGVHIQRVPYFLKISKGFILRNYIFTALDRIKKTDQVLINLPQFEGFIIAVVAKIMKKKVHCFYHCDVILRGGLINRIPEYLLRLSNTISLTLADSIIVTSDDFSIHESSIKRYRKKTTAIYPVIKFPEVNQEARRKLEKRFVPKKQFTIGFIGRMASEKGVQYLLGSIPYLKSKIGQDFVIVFAGPKYSTGENKYAQMIAELQQNYHENILLLGELHEKELGAFYSLLDILIVPSINSTEAFGLVQVEAMVTGVPVVVSDLPGVRVPVEKTGMGVVVASKNSAALARGIIAVVYNRKKYIKSKLEIHKEFSHKNVLNAYKKIFS